MKKYLFLLLLFSSLSSLAQNQINGPSTGTVNVTYRFEYPSLYLFINPQWQITNGTRITSGQVSGVGAWADIRLGTCGTTTITFRSGTTTLATKVVAVTEAPANAALITSPTLQFYDIANGTLTLTNFSGTVLKWQSKLESDITWSDITNTTTTLSFSNLNQNRNYRAVVGTSSCFSNEVLITVKPMYFAGAVQGPTFVIGSTNSINLSLLNANGTIQNWQESSNGITWMDIAGANQSSLLLTNLAVSKFYRVKLIKAGVIEYSKEHFVAWRPTIQPTDVVKNYITEQAPRIAESNASLVNSLNNSQKVTSTTYSDGLGRVFQKVLKGFSPTQKDLISFEENLPSNQKKSYLPFTDTGSDFYANAKSLQSTFYNSPANKVADDAMPYSVTTVEASPLSRVLSVNKAGADWQNNSSASSYKSNLANEIRIWKEDGTSSAFYPEGTLFVQELKDENNNLVKSYTDKAGRLVEKHVQENTSSWLKTIYIYDESDRLKYIIQPQGVHTLGAATTISTSILQQFAFQYFYDAKNRVVEKKEPGADPTFYVYDRFNRLVLLQDGNLRQGNKWMFIKYDILNRPIAQGIYVNTNHTSRTSIQTNVVDPLYSSGLWYEERSAASGSVEGYSNITFPTNNFTIWSVNYYDNYDFNNDGTAEWNYTPQSLTGEHIQADAHLKPTGSKMLVLGTNHWIMQYIFYNDKEQPIQIRHNNHKRTALDNLSTTVYNFDGTIKQTKSVHITDNQAPITLLVTNEYDHAGRITQVMHKINNETEIVAARYEYNELGQVVDKKLHSTDAGNNFLQSVDYRYNINGWLTHINDPALAVNQLNDESGDYFGMELIYQNALTNLGNTPQFNGNISASIWKSTASGQNEQSAYAYTYDKTDRLTQATFKAGSAANWNTKINTFNEQLTYDKNGNISTLQRNQATVTGTAEQVDNLQYTYQAANGNRLDKVVDLANEKGFNNGSSGSTSDYAYSTTGSLTADKNKGIDSIKYNDFGKPARIKFTDGKVIRYTYSGNGQKLSMITEAGGNTIARDYVNGYEYVNNRLDFFASPEGRVMFNQSNSFEYQYSIADHLGNSRVVFTSKAPTPNNSLATLETNNQANERSNFLKYDDVKRVNAAIFNQTSGGSSQFSIRLSGNQNERYGLARSLSVAPGDKVKAKVFAKYVDPNPSNWTSVFQTLIGNIAANASGVVVTGENYGTPQGSTIPFAGNINHNSESGTAPKAYLNWLVFDKNFNFIAAKSGFKRMTEIAKENGADVPHEELLMPEIEIEQAGYVYLYLSNENAIVLDVYFDDFEVTHTPTRIVQYNEYYPYGLQTANSWTRENTNNNYLYNASSELNSSTSNYEMPFRDYDPAIGRMNQIDPVAAKYNSLTPYNYSFNNPVLHNDPSGADPDSNPHYWWEFSSTHGANRAMTLMQSWQSHGDAYLSRNRGIHWTHRYNDPLHNLGLMSTRQFESYYNVDLSSMEGKQWAANNLSSRNNYTQEDAYHIGRALNLNVYVNKSGELSYATVAQSVLVSNIQGDIGNKFYLNSYELFPAIVNEINGGGSDGKNWATDFMYEVNKWNPIANVYNAISTYITGYDSYGVKQSNAEATLQLATIIPIGKVLNVGKFAIQPNAVNHIFRNAAGHVNPSTATSQLRYLNLFSSVASNPNNLVPTANLTAREAGVLTYVQTFNSGQVWVQVFEGKITNAGVNKLP